ncbi:hypothetical protein HPB47_021108 [Ixodes persulcatus]|uniref:Uncharacterized protein n=1 Tax=Ixodes persulcatus TaxID=34615 RepID=A0AC60QDH6_IXOPE|nr:hypothetical protein HPB47_021108 [Ixodes persulcatus]
MKSTAPKARQVTQKIAAFIAGGLHSYNIVEANGFVEMLRLLELRTAISAELSASDSVENLSPAEWKLMAGLVIPLLECTEITLKEYISEANEVASFAISLLRSRKTRFVDVKMSPLLVSIFESIDSERCVATDAHSQLNVSEQMIRAARALPCPLAGASALFGLPQVTVPQVNASHRLCFTASRVCTLPEIKNAGRH